LFNAFRGQHFIALNVNEMKWFIPGRPNWHITRVLDARVEAALPPEQVSANLKRFRDIVRRVPGRPTVELRRAHVWPSHAD
jgi:hypothetical protein